jgi:uncharacterized protein YbjT (DUF2867 family)
MNVLVTGGTGTLGRHVVRLLRNSGHRARILSRNPRGHVDAIQGDLTTGAGLIKALAGMDAIIHAASATTQITKHRATDVVGTRRLLAMAREERVRHVVFVSIVGMEGVAFPYYRTKLAAEAVVQENIIPWSILRHAVPLAHGDLFGHVLEIADGRDRAVRMAVPTGRRERGGSQARRGRDARARRPAP